VRLPTTRALATLVVAATAASSLGCMLPGEAETDEPDFESACPRGLTRPFTVHALIDAAHAHGITLRRAEECTPTIGDVEAATNSGASEEARLREGHVLCRVADLPPPHEAPRVRRTKYPEDEETYFDVGNVSCAIYPEKDSQVHRLRQAMGDLARSPAVTRECPRTPPVPIGTDELRRRGRAHGIELRRDERCVAPGVVDQASNVLDFYRGYGPGEPAWDQIEAEQGRVICLLRRGGSAARVEEKGIVTTRFVFRNVECWVSPLPDTNRKQVEAVRDLFDDLEVRYPG
jgi:hypothetical protein